MMVAPLFSLTIEVRPRDAEPLGGLLMELGAGAVEERTFARRSSLVIYGEARQELSALAARASSVLAGFQVPASAVRIARAPAFDWQAAVERQMRPRSLTRRLRVEPLTSASEPRPSGVIALKPGLAFGDGSHPTTRLAARAVERLCLREPGLRVLDVGTGSGVLAFVAAKSGAASVLGVETDAAVLALARKNARANPVTCPLLFRARLPRDTAFDLVVANLEPRVLVAEAGRIASAAHGARWLLVTGFLVSQDGMVGAAFESKGCSLDTRTSEQGWRLFSLIPAKTCYGASPLRR
jgi:ribosomal protein L11 methyltransferase